MSIVTRNSSLSNSNVSAQFQGTEEFLKAGFLSARSGTEGAIYNHKGLWNGYRGGIPSVIVYGDVYKLNAVHGYKGVPRNTELVVRVSQNYIIADFQ